MFRGFIFSTMKTFIFDCTAMSGKDIMQSIYVVPKAFHQTESSEPMQGSKSCQTHSHLLLIHWHGSRNHDEIFTLSFQINRKTFLGLGPN